MFQLTLRKNCYTILAERVFSRMDASTDHENGES